MVSWLVILVASAAGGWYFGRGLAILNQTTAPLPQESQQNESVLTADSPMGRWTARVKQAAPEDFPHLLEEWATLFPETDADIQGQPEQALRWLYAHWLIQDQKGFLSHLMEGKFNWTSSAAEILAQLKPDLSADLLSEGKLDEYLASGLASRLAAQHPLLYLPLNPDGTKNLLPPSSHMASDDWENAIKNLATSDPLAAANAWKKRKLENNYDQVIEALLPAFENWRKEDPPIKDWLNGIEDPEMRNLAQHARLMALARKNPHAALSELYSTHLLVSLSRHDAPREILSQLTQQDLPAALRLLKETSPLFAANDESSSGFDPAPPANALDPFADAPEPKPSPPAPTGPPPNPFTTLSQRADNTPEDNWVRSDILHVAAEHLPKNPDEMFARLHQLRSEMGGENPWLHKIEAELIRNASYDYDFPFNACLEVAKRWAAELKGGRDDQTFKSLAARAAASAPDKAEAALESLPESARASFAAEIVKQIPPDQTERRLALLKQLTPAQWDKELGASLGEVASQYADVITALPGAVTSGAREAFMKKWVQTNPETATKWFATLPQDDAAGPAAVGLFIGWVDYDKSAAVDWAKALPNGSARQAIALEVVRALGISHPAEAWRWAASITDPKIRAWAYNTISGYRNDEPEAFRKEHQAALQAAGMD